MILNFEHDIVHCKDSKEKINDVYYIWMEMVENIMRRKNLFESL